MATPTEQTAIPYLTASEIRSRFVEFFAERGHTIVPSASLVPAGDQTLLFTNSGMVQFKDALIGVEKRDYVRAVDYQRVPARRREAQRLRGGRPDAAPPHAVRDARQLELRRLLQARRDPVGVGVPDPRPQDPGGAPRGHRLHDRRPRALGLEGRDRPAARAPRPMGQLPRGRREELVADGRHRAVRPVLGAPLRPRRAPVRGPGVRARTTASTARAGSRSGTSCSWSSSSTRTAR